MSPKKYLNYNLTHNLILLIIFMRLKIYEINWGFDAKKNQGKVLKFTKAWKREVPAVAYNNIATCQYLNHQSNILTRQQSHLRGSSTQPRSFHPLYRFEWQSTDRSTAASLNDSEGVSELAGGFPIAFWWFTAVVWAEWPGRGLLTKPTVRILAITSSSKRSVTARARRCTERSIFLSMKWWPLSVWISIAAIAIWWVCLFFLLLPVILVYFGDSCLFSWLCFQLNQCDLTWDLVVWFVVLWCGWDLFWLLIDFMIWIWLYSWFCFIFGVGIVRIEISEFSVSSGWWKRAFELLNFIYSWQRTAVESLSS